MQKDKDGFTFVTKKGKNNAGQLGTCVALPPKQTEETELGLNLSSSLKEIDSSLALLDLAHGEGSINKSDEFSPNKAPELVNLEMSLDKIFDHPMTPSDSSALTRLWGEEVKTRY